MSRCPRSSILSRRRRRKRRKSGSDCPNGNVGVTIAFGDKAATDAAFAEAKHVASVRLVNNRVTANPIEPRCALGVYDAADGRYTLYTTSQDPHSVRAALSSSHVLHVPESKITRDLARRRRRLRHEGQSLSRRRPGAVGSTALRPAGQMDRDAQRKPASAIITRAIRSSTASWRSTRTASSSPSGRPAYQALGAYWWAAATAPLFWSVMFVPSLYDVQTSHISTSAVFTNTAPTSVYRGAGRPEAIYLIERLVERRRR